MPAQQARPIKTEVSIDRELNRNYTSIYRVTTYFQDSPRIVLTAPGLPNRYGTYFWYGDSDSWAYLAGIAARPVGDNDIGGVALRLRDWEVIVNHSTDPNKRNVQDNANNTGDPTLEPVKIRGSFIRNMRSTHRDRNDNLIANKALELYNPPIQTEESRDSISVSFNTWYINLDLRATFRDRVNSATFWKFPRRQVKMESWEYDILYIGAYQYVRHDITFAMSKEHHAPSCDFPSGRIGWHTTLPNTGFQQLVSGKQTPILVNDVKTPSARILNCAGADVGSPVEASVTYRCFEVEEEANFNSIPGIATNLPGVFI